MMPGKARHRRAGVVVVAAVVVAATVLPALAAGGSVVLTSGTSPAPEALCPESADSSGLVYLASAPDVFAPGQCPYGTGTTEVLAHGSATPTALTGFPLGASAEVAGTLVTAPTSNARVDYATVGSASVHHFTIPGSTYLAGSPDGVYTYTIGAGGLTLYDVATTTPGTPTELGTIAALAGFDGAVQAVADSSGLLLNAEETSSPFDSTFYYFDLGTHDVTALDVGASFGEVYLGADYQQFALASGEAVWLDFNAGSNKVYSAPLTGAAGQDVTLPLSSAYYVDNVATTGALIGYTASDYSINGTLTTFGTVAAPGYSTASASTPVEGTWMAGDASDFFVNRGATRPDAGLYELANAGATPQLEVAAAVSPVQAFGVGIGPGRVAYSDDVASGGALSAFARNLSAGAHGLSAGSQSLLSSDATGFGLSLSGRSAAYLGGSSRVGCHGDLRLSVPGAKSRTVTKKACGAPTLSGERLLYLLAGAKGTDNVEVYDLVTHATKRVVTGVLSAAMWGNYLAWMTTNGSVYRKALSGPAGRKKLTGALGGSDIYGGVFTAGPWVAWYEGNSNHYAIKFRDAQTLAAARSLPEADAIEGLSAGYLAVAVYDNTAGDYAVTLDSLPALHGVLTVSTDQPATLAVDGATLAWVDTSNVARAQRVSAVDRPWFLGDPAAPAKVAKGARWSAHFPTSAALSSATVTVRLGHKVVATLKADKAYLSLGVVAVTWHAAKAGHYTWTLSAHSPSGTMRSDSGSSAATTGSLTVT
jgi:hypothetical protein